VTDPEAKPETEPEPAGEAAGDAAASEHPNEHEHEQDHEPTADAEPTGDALFEVLWAKVMASWEDDKVHTAVLEYSVTAERLPDLAGRYRALKDDAVKGERAKKRLDAIILAATHLMMSMKTPANSSIPLSITLSVAGIAAFAVAFVAYAILHPH
jgi:hypothetical protein